MSYLNFIKTRNSPTIYAELVGDATRSNFVQPVDSSVLQALGVDPSKNVKESTKITPTSGQSMSLDFIKQWSKGEAAGGAMYGNGPDSDVAKIARGEPINFGYYQQLGPQSEAEMANNAKVAAQMQAQDAAQQAASAQAQTQSSPVSAAGFEDTSTPQSQAYTIKKGDTLSALAKKYGTTVQALMAANPNIKDANKIYAGASLNIPGGGQSGAVNPGATDASAGTQLVKVLIPGTGSIDSRTVSVKPDSILAQTYGVYDPAAGSVTGGSNPAAADNTSDQQNGANPQALPPIYENALSSLENYINTLVQQGQIVNPDLQLTPDQINKFMDQAKTEMAPWHSQQIKQAQDDLVRNLNYQAAEEQSLRGQQDIQNQVNQESLANSMAERGLAQSGIRNLAKQRLDQQYQGVVESTKRRYGQTLAETGNAAERLLGSQNLPTLAGIPAVEGQAFAPVGGTTGTLESQQEKEIAGRAQELAGAARNQSASLIM